MEQFISGELKKIFRHFLHSPHWFDSKWRACLAGGGGNKKRYQYCTDSSGTIVYLRALQGHSGCNLTQNLSNRQTVFFLLVDPMDKNYKDPDVIDLNVPRRAQYLHKAWKRHQDAVYWVDINLAMKKGLKFYQSRSNAIFRHATLPAYCIPNVVRMETGEAIYEKVYASPRLPPKISSKHDWKRELVSEHAQRPEVGQLSRSFQSNQPVPNPSRDRSGQPVVRTDRLGQPVVEDNTRTVQDGRKTSRSQEIDVNSFHEETVSSDRSGQPVVETSKTHTLSSDDSKSLNVELAHDRSGQPVVETHTENVPDGSQTRSFHESTSFNVGDKTIRDRTGQPVVNCDETSHEQRMLNEVNMDFRIPGLPHSVVKQAESSRVRELVKKIENHPDRHALQQDLRQNKAYNPFSAESKRMIQEVGNVELFELFETDPKTQCKACLSYWSEGIVYCSCGHLLKETVAIRGFIEYTLDLLSIPEYVIK